MPLALLALWSCHAPSHEEPAIVVWITVDTLGAALAEKVDTCATLGAVVEGYGLDLACMDGAVAPSSWTGESHTRFLFPAYTAGDRRAAQYPDCGETSVLGAIREARGGAYLFGSDNSVLGDSGKDRCGLFRTVYTQGADRVWETSLLPSEIAPLPGEERPVDAAIDTFAHKVGAGGDVQIFLNFLEPGAHEPRCWFDPSSAACDEAWDIAATSGLVDADADREATWLDSDFYGSFVQLFAVRRADEEARWRPLFWGMYQDAANTLRDGLFYDRLRRMLDAVRDAGRLGDLRLVVVGDHGENPCVARALGEDTLNCGHNGVPTPYTAFVPVYTSPASLAEGWREDGLAGTDGAPWSLVNVGYGLVDDVGVARPASWPGPEPVGRATSWICKGPDGGGQSGVRIEGTEAVRCRHGTCDAVSFVIPTDETATAAPLETVPDSLAGWMGSPDWFTTACAGG